MTLPLQRYFELLSAYLRPQAGRAALLAGLLAGSVGLQLANPQILRFFIDTALAGGPLRLLTNAALAFLAIALVQQVAGVAATFVTEQVGWTATNALRSDLAAHCLRLDLSLHEKRRPGEWIERIDGDVSLLFDFFSTLVVNVITNLALIAGVLLLLLREDWRIGLGLAVVVTLMFGAMLRIRRLAVPRWLAEREVDAGFFGFVGEQLGGVEDVRANGARGYVLSRLGGLLRRWFPLRRDVVLSGAALWGVTLLAFGLGNAGALGAGGELHAAGALSLGSVYLIFHYTELIRRPIDQIRRQLVQLLEAEACIERVEELRATRPQLRDGTGPPPPPGALGVSVRGVGFAYGPDEAPALREVSFELPPGGVLGVAGRTGSGKSTLARLLARLDDPDEGEIRLGGRPLPSIPLRCLRERVAVVTQDVQIFHASVRDNLSFFDSAQDDAALVGALDEVGLGDWLRALPDGLDTPLAADAAPLSAGEAQLLALARAFLRAPDLVILDEAVSRLDPATERRIDRAAARLLAGRTAIVIAHQHAGVQLADSMLVLGGGRVVERGSRARLLADPGSRLRRLLAGRAAEATE